MTSAMASRRQAYNADITYGTNNEIGFDYLRDNMAIYKDEQVQRGHNFAIVDEVDSILIDEARTPLIISGMGDKSPACMTMAESLVARMKKRRGRGEDKVETDEQVSTPTMWWTRSQDGHPHRQWHQQGRGVFQDREPLRPGEQTIAHHINQAIKAHGVMKRDVDYVIKDGECIIVDEFTGRLMFGRRYSEGLHQAIEAKERVQSPRRARRWPPSPSRTTSVCIRSCPV